MLPEVFKLGAVDREIKYNPSEIEALPRFHSIDSKKLDSSYIRAELLKKTRTYLYQNAKGRYYIIQDHQKITFYCELPEDLGNLAIEFNFI